MRILDIVLNEAEKKIYAIGDSHAVAIAQSGNFVNLATNGRSAFSPSNDAAVGKVPAGSTVVLSAGANDMLSANKAGVVSRVQGLVDELKKKKCKVYYVLFAETDNPKFAKDRNQLRDQMSAGIGGSASIIDMGSLQYDPKSKKDGIHAPMSWYSGAAKKVSSGAASTPAAAPAATPTQQTVPKPSTDQGQGGKTASQTSTGVGLTDLVGNYLKGGGAAGTAALLGGGIIDKIKSALGGKTSDTTSDTTSSTTSGKASDKPSNKTPASAASPEIDNLSALPANELTAKAKASAESYLGRPMSDKEWNWLVRATSAESAFNLKSYAMVMGTILNHTRTYAPNAKDGVIVALRRKNAFQAVTGTKADKHAASPHFLRGPNAKQLQAICTAAIEYLPRVSRAQMNFTATDPRAYGPGTNIRYLHQLRKKGGQEIAGSHFNTKLSG